MILIFALACGEEEKPVQLSVTESSENPPDKIPAGSKENNDCLDYDLETCLDCFMKIYDEEFEVYNEKFIHATYECATCSDDCSNVCIEYDCDQASSTDWEPSSDQCWDCAITNSWYYTPCYYDAIDICSEDEGCSTFHQQVEYCLNQNPPE